MWKKVSVFALAIIASGLALAPSAKAGDEMVVPDQTPAPRYDYAPPAPIYYSRPIVRVYPVFGYSAWPYGTYGYYRPYHHRYYGHRYHGGGHRAYGHRAYGRAYHRR